MIVHKSESPVAAGLSADQTKTTNQAIVGPHSLDRKDLDTFRARFARRRYVLQRVFRADDGRVTYHVTSNAQNRVFSHPHDLVAFLAVVESLP